jgi:hypothetical protein
VAVTLCKNRLETARTFSFDNLSSLREPAFVCDADGGQNPNGYYQRTTTVSNSVLSSTNLAEVVVEVKIRNRSTGLFSSQGETVQSLFTKY